MSRLNKKMAFSIMAIMFALGLSACSKGSNEADSTANGADKSIPPSDDQANNMTDLALQMKLPQPDKSIGLDKYQPVKSGETLLYVYYALSKMPVDISEVCSMISNDYRNTQDEFKKQDIIKALEPKIKENLASHANNRYLAWESYGRLNQMIGHYDFKQKVFPINEDYWGGHAGFYLNDVSQFSIAFNAPESLHALKVEDEAVARQIEKMLTEYKNATLYVYAFAQEADINKKYIHSIVTAFELRDENNHVIAKQSM